MLILTHQQQTAFENIEGKEEIACNKQFLLFPQCFLLNQKLVSPFVNIYGIISLFAVSLEEPKIGILGRESSFEQSAVPFEEKRRGPNFQVSKFINWIP